eukprot:gnl/TRDRNA2_/TRDRNA2_90612_c0_seq2.p1 gnl/TRDRNA2_/TRDRNA2_90612_c0~~gnl/TRDRNA2_/TRDRNA2_90612_c0_seq2.p1  ORF type:complete len:209 (+),score=26.75 gnl/TRDRNA2_/TRDRNA2_90612_c0_seq2:160-786(+)
MHDASKSFFEEQFKDAANRRCIDCNRFGATWASISYGCYFCLDCSGRHRSLGTHISFVRSIAMDKWKDEQLQRMRVGGNQRLRSFLEQYGLENAATEEKYQTRACEYYRDYLCKLADGAETLPTQPSIEEGRKRVTSVARTVPKYDHGSHVKSCARSSPEEVHSDWMLLAPEPDDQWKQDECASDRPRHKVAREFCKVFTRCLPRYRG